MRLLYTIRYCLFLTVFVLLCFSVQAQYTQKQEVEYAQSNNKQHTLDSLNHTLAEVHDTAKIYTLCLMSRMIENDDIEAASRYADKAIAIAERLQYTRGKAKAYRAKGNIFWVKADFKNALFYYLNALRLHETINDKNGIAEIYHNIGVIYGNLGQTKWAKRYYLASISLKKELDNTNIPVYTYTNLGALLFREGDYKESIRYFKKVEQLTRQYHDDYARNIVLMNLGEAYLQLNKLDTAAYYFNMVLNSNNTSSSDIAACKRGLGQIAMKQNRLDLAQQYLLLALAITEHTGANKMRLTVLGSLSGLYGKRGEYKKALQYNQQYYLLKDSINNVAVAEQMKQIQENYEIEKRDKQIQLFNKDKEVAEARIDKERLLKNVFVAVFACALIITVVIAMNIVLRQKVKNKTLSEEKASIERNNIKLLHENTKAKYEVLKSKINPHFLFNSFTILSSLIMTDRETALRFMGRFSRVFRAILNTSDKDLITLEKEMEIVNDYLFLQKMRYGERLVTAIQIDRELEQLSVPPFSLQMTVENAIKHNAVPEDEKIYITISANEQYIMISNNFSNKKLNVMSTSTGQQNITERYQALTSWLQPEFLQKDDTYIVKLPLIKSEKRSRLAIDYLAS